MLRIKPVYHPFLFFTLPLATVFSLTYFTVVRAQITPDNSLGAESSVVTPNVLIKDIPSDRIDGGATRGANLFHSFQEFNINAGRGAYFSNPAGIANILTRVTGGNISNIQGILGVLGKANLFLINPNGILFGPNARLDVGGSFLGSTANSLIFNNNFEFSATNPQAPPLLTINIPIGLRYRDNPGVIQVNGPGSGLPSEAKDGPREKFDSDVTGLKVEPGKTLALVGGKVSVEGGVLRSEGGRVEIGSFDSNQVVKILPQEQGFSLGYEGTPSFRDIEFSKKSFVNVTGDGGGSIAIKGKNINLNSESLLLSDTYRDKNGGEISIVGDSISFSNRSSALANTFSSGDGAQIKLDANNIKFENKSGLNIQTWDKGKAGDIIINAKDSLEIKGGSAFTSVTTGSSTGNAGDINVTVNGLMTVTGGINTNSEGTGKAGTININANSLQIENSGIFSKVLNAGQAGEINFHVADSLRINGLIMSTNTSGRGDAGKINIKANSFRLEQAEVSSQALENSTGNAGEINITAGTLEFFKGTGIKTTTAGTGDAGKININANSSVLSSDIFSSTTENSTGNAGKININANSLQIEGSNILSTVVNTGQGGEINLTSADSLGIKYSTISTETFGTGDAGKININANSLRLEGVGVISNTNQSATGNAGEININVAGTLQTLPSVGIDTKTFGVGNAGKINIRANSLLLKNSAISSKTEESGTGNAGEIKITVADQFDLNTTGVTTVNLGNGNGGNIKIEANNFDLTNGSRVRASTSGKGNGGSVTVNATGNISADGKYIFDPIISADGQIIENIYKSGFYSTVESSGVGNAGGVNITARSLSLTNEAKISTSNSGKGAAGDITVTTAKDIRLDNQGSIDANTNGGKGNITLNSRDLILRNNSSITTNAKGEVDGGNIKINNTGNLVVFEDSKITADAEKGYGGNIIITARGIFRYPDSITATSEAGPQFNGTVQFNTPDIDPTRGLFELSEAVIDPAQQIAQHPCIKGFGSTFTITGRGGLPTDPKNILSGDNVRVDLVQPVASTVSSTSTTQKEASQEPTVKKIIPAQGWIFNEKGEVLLVGYDPTKTGPQRRQPASNSSCAAVK